jgi:transposase
MGMPDQVIKCTQDSCPNCGGGVRQLAKKAIVCQQVEIPVKIAYITQYEKNPFCCESCGHKGFAPLPPGIEESAFGPRLKSLIATCTGNFHLSKRETQGLLRDFLGIQLCVGSVSNIEWQTSHLLAPAYEAISREVLRAKVVYLDETGWRESAQNHFVWVASCVNAVFYRIDPRRNREARDKLLGKKYRRPTVTDRYGVYDDLAGAHQYCLAHFDRDLEGFSEKEGYDREWALKAITILDKVFDHWHRYKEGIITRLQLKHRCRAPREDLEDLLIVGGWYESRSSRRLRRFCQDIFKRFDWLWTFLRVEFMEPTNNRAERDLRKLVLWRKKSFGTKSDRGERFVERIKTVAMTLHRQKRSLFGYLTSLLQATFSGCEAPSPI